MMCGVLTLTAVQCAGESAGAPGQGPVDIAAKFLLCDGLSGASVLPETATLRWSLTRLPGWLHLNL